jgi:Pyroglutamyl peptidase
VCKIHEKPYFTKTLLKTTSSSLRSSATKPRSALAHAQSSVDLPCVLVTGFEAFGDDPSGQGLNPMLTALQDKQVPCELSSSAGHFVCNHVFYALMHSQDTMYL